VVRRALPIRLLALCVTLGASGRALAQEPPSDEPVHVPAPVEPQPAPIAAPPAPVAAPLAHAAAPPAVPPPGAPNEAPRLIWKWRAFSAVDYVIAGTGGAVTLATAIVHPRAQHSFTRPLGFDTGVRNLLRGGSLDERYDFRDASEVGVSLALAWPLLGDALTTAWWYRGSRETAQEMALIDLEAMAIAGAVQGATNVLVSRERPLGRDCGGALPSDALDCRDAFRYRSFFSGHSANSFTGAALVCIHHFENDLLGAPGDALSCAGAYAVAATTAAFRVVADVHYASDVLIGAAVGSLVGYGVPLVHYAEHRSDRARGHAASPHDVQISLVPAPGGVGLFGVF
jgi:membrane-associated phospholipid phosphatase